MSEALDIDTLREQFLGHVFDEQAVTVSAAEVAAYAAACGEREPRYTDPQHADFQAPPTFASSLRPGRRMPEGFPDLPGIGMDAGKAVTPHGPLRPGVEHKVRSHLHDIYAKTGRSGRMTFLVTRMEVYDPDETLVAAADTRIVIRERGES